MKIVHINVQIFNQDDFEIHYLKIFNFTWLFITLIRFPSLKHAYQWLGRAMSARSQVFKFWQIAGPGPVCPLVLQKVPSEGEIGSATQSS